jgi:hypothetical protein
MLIIVLLLDGVQGVEEAFSRRTQALPLGGFGLMVEGG